MRAKRHWLTGGLCGLGIGLVLAAAPARGDVPAECPDGSCAPHCPVRPGQFGYYPTQWRRWPGGERPVEGPRDTTTPSPPARSIVPGPGEESPPTPGSAPAAAVEPGADRGIARLVAEADAMRLMGAVSQREFTGRLVSAMLTEADPESRCVVLGLAAGFDTPAAEAICTGALDDPDPRVRSAACRICADRGGAGSVERLALRAREDVDLGVRLRAIRALGDVGSAAAVSHLVALLDDADPAVQARTAAALERATGRRLGADVERWKAWAADPRAPAARWSPQAAIRRWF